MGFLHSTPSGANETRFDGIIRSGGDDGLTSVNDYLIFDFLEIGPSCFSGGFESPIKDAELWYFTKNTGFELDHFERSVLLKMSEAYCSEKIKGADLKAVAPVDQTGDQKVDEKKRVAKGMREALNRATKAAGL